MIRRQVFAIFLLTVCALSALAQEAGRVVRDIEVKNIGSGRIDENYVLAHTSTRIGQELMPMSVSRDLKELLKTGLFSSAKVEAEALGDGIRLIYLLRRKWTLTEPVEVRGAKKFSENRIRSWLDLRVGDPVDDQVMGAHTRKILDEYRQSLYSKADCSWSIIETDAEHGLARVILKISEGGKSRVRSMEFTGNKNISRGALLKAVNQPSRFNPIYWFKAKRYDPDDMKTGRLAIEDIYKDQGYLAVDVGDPIIESDDKGRLDIEFNIKEGPRYYFGDSAIEGVSLFPVSRLEQLISIQKGEPASMTVIRESAIAVRDYYGTRGYLDTVVTPAPDVDREDKTVDVLFSVREGRLTRIRNIKIRGNTRTKDKVIRRELLVYPGDIYDTVRVTKSERRLSNLGYFSRVQSHPVSTTDPLYKDLLIELDEKRTGTLMVGAGFSSIDKLVGYAEITQGNFDIGGWPFTGGGQKLRVRTQFGSSRKDYEVSFVEPWFLDMRLALGLDLYRTERSYTDYDIERTGGAISLTKGLPGANKVKFEYRIEDSAITDIADPNPYVYVDLYEKYPDEPYLFTLEKDATESSFGVTFTHDTRNNPFIPTAGRRISAFGSVSGGAFGFDTDIYKLGLNGKQYVPLWFGHVLSFSTDWEVVEEYGDTEEVPLSDRLFIGGGQTLRGFEYRDVGPKVRPLGVDPEQKAYRPVGGRSLAMASAEYTVPVFMQIRLATFFDIGNVWRDAYEFDFGRLGSTAGVGLRLDMPGFPIRIDRAWIIEPDDDLTDSEDWVFSLRYDY